MDDDEREVCTICYGNYDEDIRRPRCLPCGHTLCSYCIEHTIENAFLTCPSCRTQHRATSPTMFPINYFAEVLLKKHSGAGASSNISDKFQHLVQEQKGCIRTLITGCEAVMFQLQEYREKLKEWKTRHLQFQKKVTELNNAAIRLLEQEDASLDDYITRGKKHLGTVSLCFATLTIEQAAIITERVDSWIKKCKERFPDSKVVLNSTKLLEAMGEGLEIMTTTTGVTAASTRPRDSASSITEQIEHITGTFSLEHLSLDGNAMSPMRMSEHIRRLAVAGRVMAVHDDESGRRSARITSEDGELYLHTLLRQPAPAYILKYSDLVDRLDPVYTHAFLDLGWAGSTIGRVIIRLCSDTPRGKQFVLLCTGQLGPSYLNTRLFRVEDKGRFGERVFGGDYESNDGRGGASLLHPMGTGYEQAGSEGDVWSWTQESHRSAQFAISTKDFSVNGSARLICLTGYPCVFGKVVKGLDVVKAAINHNNITEVSVVDCGVVLPLHFTVSNATHLVYATL